MSGGRRNIEGELALTGGAAGRGRGRLRGQRAVRANGAGINPSLFGDAARDGGEFHRLEEGDQVLVVRFVHREFGDVGVERHVLIERYEALGDARLVGDVLERLAALVVLDLVVLVV